MANEELTLFVIEDVCMNVEIAPYIDYYHSCACQNGDPVESNIRLPVLVIAKTCDHALALLKKQLGLKNNVYKEVAEALEAGEFKAFASQKHEAKVLFPKTSSFELCECAW